MKSAILACSAVVWLLAGAGNVAHAAAPEELAKKYLCLSCHSAAKKVVGPSYKDIAARYQGKGAEATLVEKIRKGSSGVWGPVPMPPNAAVSEADAQVLVQWVLSH